MCFIVFGWFSCENYRQNSQQSRLISIREHLTCEKHVKIRRQFFDERDPSGIHTEIRRDETKKKTLNFAGCRNTRNEIFSIQVKAAESWKREAENGYPSFFCSLVRESKNFTITSHSSIISNIFFVLSRSCAIYFVIVCVCVENKKKL